MVNSIKQLKERLKWLEETPCYLGEDGMPSILIILTGILPAIILILILRAFEKTNIKNKIAELERLSIKTIKS